MTLVFPSSGFASSVEQKLTEVSIESSETDTGEDRSGGAIGIGVLIGAVLGVIVVASLVGALIYREWSRRQIPIGDVSVVLGAKGHAIPNTNIYVDHVASNQVVDVDTHISEAADINISETKEQFLEDLTASGSLNKISYLDDESIESLSKGITLNSKRIVTDNNENLWEYSVKDIEYECTTASDDDGPLYERTDFPEDMIGFTTKQPMFQRSYSALCAEEAGVPLDVIQEVLTREGRVESDRARVLLAAQEVLNSRNDTTDYRSISEMSAVISTDVTNSSAPSA